MSTLQKLKEIISDKLDTIATNRESHMLFICENEKEFKVLSDSIYDEFNIFLNPKNFETLGNIEDFINRTKEAIKD